ncbi:MAG: hypothetical protein JWO67_4305 [Streptosporangiaceae bacterium]|nr:hypothetical protein [Streptosporangiaceae bacterium]
MQVRLLGPVQLRDRDGPVPIGPRVRVVLAALALSPGRAVSVQRLVSAVWPEDPPVTATAQIQACVSALRRAISDAGLPARDVVVTTPPGYMLSAGSADVDVLRFDGELAEAAGAAAAGDHQEAAALLREALARWRGRALEGFPGLAVEATRLEERRVSALERRFDADLACGGHVDLIPELASLVAEHPLRERFRGQLMLALHGAGRQSEALEVYQDGRRFLVEELGLEPGPELREVQRQVLLATYPRQVAHIPAPEGCEPSPLPPDVPDFTGRRAQAAGVIEAIATDPHTSEAVPTVAITGCGGVGKTTLAVHVAHRLRERFCDGRLYADLRAADGRAADPSEVLARLLRRLGLEPGEIPGCREDRAELYRARLYGRRVLVVLDNADDEAQVRPLLPGSGTCSVIVTSRRRLTGLPGAVPVELGMFTDAQATELLCRVAGADRVLAEPAAAALIARLCDRLPLALRIAAARLAAKPHWRLEGFARRLADERRRLDELTHADLEVRGSIGLSHNGLSSPAQRVLRLLGLLDWPDFGTGPAAALLDVGDDQAEELIEELIDARLVEPAGRDAAGGARYRLPDLVRVYARERAAGDETAAERHAALSRALTTRLMPGSGGMPPASGAGPATVVPLREASEPHRAAGPRRPAHRGDTAEDKA